MERAFTARIARCVEILELLADDPDPRVRYQVLRNEGAPLHIRERLKSEKGLSMLAIAAGLAAAG